MHGLKKIIAGLEKRYKFYTLFCPFLMIAEVFMETLIPYLMAMIIDTGIAQKNIGFVLNKGLIMILCALISLVAGVSGAKLGASAAIGFARNLRRNLLIKYKVFRFPIRINSVRHHL